MVTIQIDALREFITEVLVKIGLEKELAVISANHMTFADAKGTDTHGIMQLPVYVKRIKDGGINKRPVLKWLNETGQSAVLDADNGMGHYVTQLAMERAIEMAREHTISFVAVRNGSHFGAAASYTHLAAKENMIGFITSNAAPLMAATGGTERVLGNNPLSFAIPRKEEPHVMLDMACSNVAMGKLVMAQNRGESIPLGWALDKEGKPTTDPYEGFQGGGTLVPIAGHKGYGLALVMDILSGVLSGSRYGKDVGKVADTTVPTGVGCAILVINVDRIMPIDLFHNRLEDLVRMVTTPQREDSRVYLPGERGAETARIRSQSGVPLTEKLQEQLKGIAQELGVETSAFGF